MIVHGIGSNLEYQHINEQSLHAGIKKVTEGGYFDSEYQVITHVVDRKTEVEKSFRFGQRLKKVTIPSHWQSAKEAFDYAVPDNLAYLNPRFRPRILETVTHQMNMIVTKLSLDEPRFKGKVSICAHSLGTVISYDLLSRQHWENFGHSTAEDTALEAIEKIRSGDIFKSRYYRRSSGEQELNTDHLAMNFLRPSFPDSSNMHAHQ